MDSSSLQFLNVAALRQGKKEVVGASTLAFLTRAALEEKRKDEVEKKAKAEEAKDREERKAKFEEKTLEVNRRVRDGTAMPAQEAAWRRWMGIAPGSSSGKRRKRKKRRRRTRHRSWFLVSCSS